MIHHSHVSYMYVCNISIVVSFYGVEGSWFFEIFEFLKDVEMREVGVVRGY